jgi:hypothetical protein
MINLGGPDQSPEQHQPLLSNNGNDTNGRQDSIDSHTSTDDGFELNDNWSSAPRLVSLSSKSKSYQFDLLGRIIPSSTRTMPVHNASPLINTAQPRPQASANSRQLPSLPTPLRQLPLIDNSDSSEPYFDIQNTENEDELLSTRLTRPGELFYYQTSTSSSTSSSSSSSNSDNSLSSANSDNQNNDEQFPNNNQEDEDEEDEDDDDDDDDDDDRRTNQQLRSDEDDDQTSPYGYEV